MTNNTSRFHNKLVIKLGFSRCSEVVIIAETNDNFVIGIDFELHNDTIDQSAKRQELARGHPWDARVQQITDNLERHKISFRNEEKMNRIKNINLFSIFLLIFSIAPTADASWFQSKEVKATEAALRDVSIKLRQTKIIIDQENTAENFRKTITAFSEVRDYMKTAAIDNCPPSFRNAWRDFESSLERVILLQESMLPVTDCNDDVAAYKRLYSDSTSSEALSAKSMLKDKFLAIYSNFFRLHGLNVTETQILENYDFLIKKVSNETYLEFYGKLEELYSVAHDVGVSEATINKFKRYILLESDSI